MADTVVIIQDIQMDLMEHILTTMVAVDSMTLGTTASFVTHITTHQPTGTFHPKEERTMPCKVDCSPLKP